jgi:hypothetical protein
MRVPMRSTGAEQPVVPFILVVTVSGKFSASFFLASAVVTVVMMTPP